MSENKIAVVLIRGMVNLSFEKKQTLAYLRLKQKHACVVVDDTKENRGMIEKVKDFVTYGLVDEKSFKALLDKRAKVVGKADVKIDTAKIAKEYFDGKVKLRDFETNYQIKPFFRLHPPIGGFERAGIKMPFGKGGVLGNRAVKINDLIVKML
jgi:large subunit ribosomal protein L30